jgi:hypothetical protein
MWFDIFLPCCCCILNCRLFTYCASIVILQACLTPTSHKHSSKRPNSGTMARHQAITMLLLFAATISLLPSPGNTRPLHGAYRARALTWTRALQETLQLVHARF